MFEDEKHYQCKYTGQVSTGKFLNRELEGERYAKAASCNRSFTSDDCYEAYYSGNYEEVIFDLEDNAWITVD
jgi:hypothetical protein